MISTIFLGNCLPQFFTLMTRTDLKAVFTRAETEDEKIQLIKIICLKKGIPVYTPMTMKPEKDSTALDTIKEIAPDFIVSGGYHLIVPQEVIDAPKLGTINIHPALLPKYRGQHVIQWQILNDEKETGTTIHMMTKGFDEGPIVRQGRCALNEKDTALDVWQKTADIGSNLLNEVIDEIEKTGKIKSFPQNDAEATHYKSRKPEDGVIDLNKSAKEIYNLVRALVHPWPGAILKFEDKDIIIEKAEILDDDRLTAGTIKRHNNEFIAGTSDKDIILVPR